MCIMCVHCTYESSAHCTETNITDEKKSVKKTILNDAKSRHIETY